jgi:tRNA A22 N-methylase
MIRHRKLRMRMRNHMVTLKEEEVLKEDHLVGEIIFLEEEEEVEEVELNVMPVERQDICLGNVPRGREKEEEKHTFLKPRRM